MYTQTPIHSKARSFVPGPSPYCPAELLVKDRRGEEVKSDVWDQKRREEGNKKEKKKEIGKEKWNFGKKRDGQMGWNYRKQKEEN